MQIDFFTMLFGGGQIPYYLVLSELGLTNSIWVYIVPGLYNVMHILLLRSSFKQLPISIVEAARIDGMSEFKIFTNIVLPLSKPTVATISLEKLYYTVTELQKTELTMNNDYNLFTTLHILLDALYRKYLDAN